MRESSCSWWLGGGLCREKWTGGHVFLGGIDGKGVLKLCSMQIVVGVFCLFVFLGLFPGHKEVPRLRGLIGAVTTGLRQSHSNVGSEPHL